MSISHRISPGSEGCVDSKEACVGSIPPTRAGGNAVCAENCAARVHCTHARLRWEGSVSLPARFAALASAVEPAAAALITTAAAAEATAIAAGRHRLRFVDGEVATAVLVLVEFADRLLRA